MYDLHVVPGFIDVLWTLSQKHKLAAEFLAYQAAVQLVQICSSTLTLFCFL